MALDALSYNVVRRPTRDRLGEGPTWLERRGELAWVDIVGQTVHLLRLSTGGLRTVALPEPVGWVLPRRGADTVVAGLRSGFSLLDLDDGSVTPLLAPEPDRPNNRLNDAKVDAAGRIWAGSKDDTDRAPSGAFYRLDPDLTCTRMDDGYGVTNGPTFSLDGRTLYHTDSAARTVYAFDLADDGTLGARREWLRFPDEWGHPDGMTTDAEGCVWIAHWGGGALSRFDPQAVLVERIELPATNITSCAFAGDASDRLFATSSTIGCEAEPAAGAIFEIRTDVRGIAPVAFAG